MKWYILLLPAFSKITIYVYTVHTDLPWISVMHEMIYSHLFPQQHEIQAPTELVTLTGSWEAEWGRSWPWHPQCCCSWGRVFPERGRVWAAPQRSWWSCCLLWKYRHHRSNKWQKILCIWLVARTSLMFPHTQTVDSLNLPVVLKMAKKITRLQSYNVPPNTKSSSS